MKKNKCIICNSRNLFFIFKKNNYDLFKCNECGLIYVYPQPALNRLINDCYSQSSGYHLKLTKNLQKIKRYEKRFIRVLDKLDEFKIRGNLLDVGCSNGEFLFIAKRKGFNTYGVEVNKETAKIAIDNGFNVFNGILEDANFKDNYFSVIHLGSVIEHVPDPVALLKESKRVLKKGGIIIIFTPNLECFWARTTRLLYQWFNFPWSALIPPYHLFLFSHSNFKKLLCGMKFKILDTRYYGCSLRHELGATGLFRKVKEEKSIKRLLYSLLVFLIYTSIYFINFLIIPFQDKNFEMIIFAQNDL